LRSCGTSGIDLIFCDFAASRRFRLELLKKVRLNTADIKFIIMTAYGSIKTAIDAMKAGAFDYRHAARASGRIASSRGPAFAQKVSFKRPEVCVASGSGQQLGRSDGWQFPVRLPP
jgi:DNA-binding NtrC family response regulator